MIHTFSLAVFFNEVPKAVANLLEHGVLICHYIIYQTFFVIILRLINHHTKFLSRRVISLNIKGLNQKKIFTHYQKKTCEVME